ncbi:MAG: tetratricopeptide repeat protein [Desulfobacteraceae bacterium]|nr:tetratricopeptide repeat protein [Desulfobacteraceae bacterium]
MAKQRITRKKLLKEPDEFITTTGKIIAWSREYQHHVIYGAIGFFALIIIVAGARFVSENNENKATMLLQKAVEKYQAAMESDDSGNVFSEVQSDFDTLMTKYAGKSAGKLATLTYGNICYKAGETDKAIRAYEKSVSIFKATSLYPLAVNGLAYAYEQKKDFPNALKYYKILADDATSVLTDMALFNMGRLYKLTGESEKSIDAYQKLLMDYPDSIYAEVVDVDVSV